MTRERRHAVPGIATPETYGATEIGLWLSRFCNISALKTFEGLRSLREFVVGSCLRK